MGFFGVTADDLPRGIRLIAFLWVFLVLLPAKLPAQEKAVASRKLESVTLGLSAKHVLNLPIYLAQRHGIFESEGFDFKPITTKTSIAIAALVSGDLDYITAFNSGLGRGDRRRAADRNLCVDRQVAALFDQQTGHQRRQSLARRDHRPWRYPRQSLSRNRGDGEIPRIGRRQGRAVDFNDRRHPGAYGAFLGSRRRATLSPPYDSIALRKGFNRLVSGPDILPRFVENGLVMRRAKLRDNPNQVRRMLRALVRGLQYATEHPTDAVALIQKEWNLDRETSQIAYDAAMAAYNFKGEASDEIVNAAIKRSQQDAKIGQSAFAPKDFVDWNLIRALQQELKR